MDYVKQELPTLYSVLSDTTEELEVEQYQCPSYYDENNELQDCTCGKCE